MHGRAAVSLSFVIKGGGDSSAPRQPASVGTTDMATNAREEKERIAQENGWSSYDDAPTPVQNNIDALVDREPIEDPFAMLRRGDE